MDKQVLTNPQSVPDSIKGFPPSSTRLIGKKVAQLLSSWAKWMGRLLVKRVQIAQLPGDRVAAERKR